MLDIWKSLSSAAKIGVSIGLILIVVLAGALGIWAYHTDYQVLFSDVASADAATMTAELERMKVPYQIADGGNTIMVPKDMVYKTRLKLMGKDIPLHGAVGFEVFNNADFGMTEFVQKVNYQRAIQGELTRTIMSIDGIQSARVHLAIPEQSLFKKASSAPKASVTLVMQPGVTLAMDQISGMQRLIAASVPDIRAEDVTVLDQRGVALTKGTAAEPGMEGASGQLDSKRSAEDYLNRKLAKILDSTFGTGTAIATVDVVLNLDQNRITTEEVLPAKTSGQEGAQTGVMVHERQTVRDGGTVVSAATLPQAGKESGAAGATSFDNEYQVGRRVEQTVVAPGTFKRITVAVVVKGLIGEDQAAKIREIVSHAIGLNTDRGDAVVVSSMDLLTTDLSVPPSSSAHPGQNAAGAVASASTVTTAGGAASSGTSRGAWWIAAAFCGLVAVGLFMLASIRKGGNKQAVELTGAQREKLLSDIRRWIGEDDTAGARAEVRK